jgi:hypothetical protein
VPNIWPSGQVTGKPRYEIIPNLMSGFDFHSSSRSASARINVRAVSMRSRKLLNFRSSINAQWKIRRCLTCCRQFTGVVAWSGCYKCRLQPRLNVRF